MRAKATAELSPQDIIAIHWSLDPAYLKASEDYVAMQRDQAETLVAIDAAKVAVEDCRQRHNRTELFWEHQRGSEAEVQRTSEQLAAAQKQLRGLEYKLEVLREQIPALNPVSIAHSARARTLAQLKALLDQWTRFVLHEAIGLAEVRRGIVNLDAIRVARANNFPPHRPGPLNVPKAPEIDDDIPEAGGLPSFVRIELLHTLDLETRMQAYLDGQGSVAA
jgi:hypothetical protein